MLYGSTYETFKNFRLADPGAATDALEYVKIARGEPDVDLTGPHFHRWVTPAAARLIQPVSDRLAGDPELAAKLSFYAVNLAISTVTGLVLFALLQGVGFSTVLSLLGVAAFATSRVTVLVTATPMADAVYFCAVVAVLYLTVARKTAALVLLLPILALSKETILPFLLLPLLTDLRRSRAYGAALAGAVLTFIISGRVVDALYGAHGPSLVDNLSEHLEQTLLSLQSLITPGGIHDLVSGFSLLIPLAAVGAWLNARHQYVTIPPVVVATIPVAAALAVLSGNLGRMVFAAFPAVIAYALITVAHIGRGTGPGTGELSSTS